MSRAAAGLINELGGQAEVLVLGEGMGTMLRGNTHIVFADMNNEHVVGRDGVV
jgi:hypothetical protein